VVGCVGVVGVGEGGGGGEGDVGLNPSHKDHAHCNTKYMY